MEIPAAKNQGSGVTPPPVVIGAPGLVIGCGLPCVHCGYDLRTIRLDGQCPECGKPCAEALGGLGAARVEDLVRARRGVVLMLIAALAPMFIVGLGALGLVLEMFGQRAWVRLGEDAIPWVIGLACAVAGPIVALGGVMRLSEPIRPQIDNGLPSPQPGEAMRQAMRSVAIAYMLASIAVFAFWMYLIQSFSPSAAAFWGASISMALTGLAWNGRNVMVSRFVATLLRLGHAPKLARWFRVLSWIASAMFGFVGLLSGAVLLLYLFRDWLDAFDTGGPSSWTGAIFLVFSLIYSLAGLGFLVWSIAWPISLALVLRRLRALERAAAGRVGPIVLPSERPAAE